MRTQRVLGLAAASIVAGAMLSAAAAQPVIDDFETGTFHLASPAGGYLWSTSSVSSPAHAMTAFREVAVGSWTVGGLPATADLDAWTIVDDKLRITLPPGGGSAILHYEALSVIDLTAGGLNDRIELSFSAVTTGANVLVMIWDWMGNNTADGAQTWGTTLAFPFASFGGVNLTQVRILQVEISNLNASAYDLRDIRAARNAAIWSKFDIPTETIVGPPYPIDPLIFNVADTMPSDLQKIRLLNATKIATGGAAAIALTGMDSDGDMAPGFAGAVRASWSAPFQAYASTAFDMQVDVSALSGVAPQPFLPALPAITPTPTGFLLAFDVHFPSDTGELVRTSKRQMPFDVLPGQHLRFDDVRVHPPNPLSPQDPDLATGTTGFRVTFSAVDTGGVDIAEPLFEATFTGDCRPATATGVPAIDAGLDHPAFSARPNVTREGVQFFLARPSEGVGRIDLFNVTGRFLRSMEVPRGSGGQFWDGRDSGGRPIAPGVYFARFTDGKRDLRTRIVCVR